jgi:hypothetical protein
MQTGDFAKERPSLGRDANQSTRSLTSMLPRVAREYGQTSSCAILANSWISLLSRSDTETSSSTANSKKFFCFVRSSREPSRWILGSAHYARALPVKVRSQSRPHSLQRTTARGVSPPGPPNSLGYARRISSTPSDDLMLPLRPPIAVAVRYKALASRVSISISSGRLRQSAAFSRWRL